MSAGKVLQMPVHTLIGPYPVPELASVDDPLCRAFCSCGWQGEPVNWPENAVKGWQVHAQGRT